MSNDATNAAIINSAGEITSSVVGNATRKKAQERAQKANIEFWKMQNAYNTPTAQMARLKEAGLNPRFIYGTSGNQSVGNAGEIAPAKAPDVDFPNPFRDFANVQFRTAQTNNLAAQNDVDIQRAALLGVQSAAEGMKLNKDTLEYKKAQELYNTSVDAQKEILRQLEIKSIGLELDNTFKDESLKNRLLDLYYRVQNAKSILTGQDRLNELRRLEIELNRNGIQKGDPLWLRFLGQHQGDVEKAINSFKDAFKANGKGGAQISPWDYFKLYNPNF